MKTLQFKCTLQSDVILNVKSASEGANATLDFIPGSCFLGIVAKRYGEFNKEKAMTVFHSGKVRFGDAHPALKGNQRSLHIPAAFYYAKGDSIVAGKDGSKGCYVHHFIEKADDITDSNGKKAQLKQCRSGFYVMNATEAHEVKTEKSFAIKSAYDRDKRRSLDAAMFGYESLGKGLELLFSVEVDDDNLAGEIKNSLVGTHRIGRSRSAQYGLVEIKMQDYDNPTTYTPNNQVVVYADSRLIFFDANNQPTFRPTVEDLLGKDVSGTINWSKTQIRTFQYAPWNFKRQCFDTDRCGIEKGSVIVIDGVTTDKTSAYIGRYNNEGFGHVIYNPDFLQAEEGGNGEAKCKVKVQKEPKPEDEAKVETTSALFKFLKAQAEQTDSTTSIYTEVNNFVKDSGPLFTGKKEKFASQWGAIRAIALSKQKEVVDENGNILTVNEQIRKCINNYLQKGIKSEDWQGARKTALDNFIKHNSANLRESIINLASAMGKECSKNTKKEDENGNQ